MGAHAQLISPCPLPAHHFAWSCDIHKQTRRGRRCHTQWVPLPPLRAAWRPHQAPICHRHLAANQQVGGRGQVGERGCSRVLEYDTDLCSCAACTLDNQCNANYCVTNCHNCVTTHRVHHRVLDSPALIVIFATTRLGHTVLAEHLGGALFHAMLLECMMVLQVNRCGGGGCCCKTHWHGDSIEFAL